MTELYENDVGYLHTVSNWLCCACSTEPTEIEKMGTKNIPIS